MSKWGRLGGWVAFWCGFGALDYQLSLRHADMSRSVREVFHTETRAGRVALGAVMGALFSLGFWHWTN